MDMICYVILHYQDINITKKSVYSLLKSTVDSKIIIVDNCSPNGSGVTLERELSNEERVTVILNPHNDGFARGNNLGYKFAKEEYNPDIIVVMNNDIIISDSMFEKR